MGHQFADYDSVGAAVGLCGAFRSLGKKAYVVVEPEKNLSKNLIESAYFTMKADSLLSTAKKSGESSAAEKLRNMLRHSAKNHSTFNADEIQKSATDLLNGLF